MALGLVGLVATVTLPSLVTAVARMRGTEAEESFSIITPNKVCVGVDLDLQDVVGNYVTMEGLALISCIHRRVLDGTWSARPSRLLRGRPGQPRSSLALDEG